MTKTAENCGGRSGSRSPDLLGVNDCDRRQIRRLIQTAKRRFPDNRPFSSVSVPEPGTNRTIDEMDLRAMEALDWQPPKKRSFIGYVYFIGGDCECVKIGFARNPQTRLRALQTGSPVPLYLLAAVVGDPVHEKEYHQQFKESWSHGEWFRKSPKLLALIAALVRKHNHRRNLLGLPNA